MSSGEATQEQAQAEIRDILQAAATADGAGTVSNTAGFEVLNLEIQKTGSGTSTVVIEGSDDGGTTWYALGYQRTDAQAAPARAVVAVSLGAGAVNELIAVLDAPVLQVRARMNATSGAVVVSAWLVKVPTV